MCEKQTSEHYGHSLRLEAISNNCAGVRRMHHIFCVMSATGSFSLIYSGSAFRNRQLRRSNYARVESCICMYMCWDALVGPACPLTSDSRRSYFISIINGTWSQQHCICMWRFVVGTIINSYWCLTVWKRNGSEIKRRVAGTGRSYVCPRRQDRSTRWRV